MHSGYDYMTIIHNYVRRRQKPPMSFIALLSNDLHGTITLFESPDQIKEIIKQVHKVVPPEARGSIFAIEQWIGKKI
jgi:hypothetical protein